MDPIAELADLLRQRREFAGVDDLEAAAEKVEARIEHIEETLAAARPTSTALVIVQALLMRDHIVTLADPRSSAFARKRAVAALDTARRKLADELLRQDREAVPKSVVEAYSRPVPVEMADVAA